MLPRTLSLSNGRSTIAGAVVVALKRDPHGQYLTVFLKPKFIQTLLILKILKYVYSAQNPVNLMK